MNGVRFIENQDRADDSGILMFRLAFLRGKCAPGTGRGIPFSIALMT